MQRVILTAIISLFAALIYYVGVLQAFEVSTHPLISLMMRVVFIAILSYLIILRKKENFLYLFILSFPFLLISFNGISVFLLLTLILSILYVHEIHEFVLRTKDFFLRPLLVLFMTALFTTVISRYKVDAFPGLILLLCLILIYVILRVFTKNRGVEGIFYCMNIVLSFALLIAFLQLILGVERVKIIFNSYNSNVLATVGISRVPSFFVDAQEAGLYFAFMICLSLGFLRSRFQNKIWVWINFILSILVLMFNGTKIAIISLIVALVSINLINTSVRRIVLIISTSCAIILFIPLIFNHLPNSIVKRFNNHELHKSSDFRLRLWKSAWPVIQHNPLGIGLGRENTYAAIIRLRKEPLLVSRNLASSHYGAHFESTYLEIICSLGVIGFFCFSYIVLKFFVLIFKSLSRSNTNSQSTFNKYLLGCMMIWVITVSTSPKFSYPHSMFIFMIILSFFDACSENKELID